MKSLAEPLTAKLWNGKRDALGGNEKERPASQARGERYKEHEPLPGRASHHRRRTANRAWSGLPEFVKVLRDQGRPLEYLPGP